MKGFSILKQKVLQPWLPKYQKNSSEVNKQHNTSQLKVLITSTYLSNYTGSELVVRDLALGFQALGHLPMVYSPKLGGVSSQIIAKNIPVVDRLAALPSTPDVIHGNHHLETLHAALLFPEAPVIFICHSRYAWESIPPLFDRISAFVAVDFYTRERLIQDYSIPHEKIEVIYNWVDMQRFQFNKPVNAEPKRALVFSSYAENDNKLNAIKLACQACNLTLDIVGFGVGTGVTNPETILGQYDVVFAKAKCALEALATGAAVIVCDKFGLGEMVTMQNVAEFRQWNFGIHLLNKPLTVENIVTEIKKYNAIDANEVTQFIRTRSNLNRSLHHYLQLYHKVRSQPKTDAVAMVDTILQYSKNQLEKIAYLERIYFEPFKMEPLPKEIVSYLKLDWIEYPVSVKINDSFYVMVKLYNGSPVRLGSYLPNPVYFSYYWLDNNKERHEAVSLRTPLEPWIACQSQIEQQVLIRPPKISGKFYLVMTLVQEQVFWLGSVEPSLALTIPVTVFE